MSPRYALGNAQNSFQTQMQGQQDKLNAAMAAQGSQRPPGSAGQNPQAGMNAQSMFTGQLGGQTAPPPSPTGSGQNRMGDIALQSASIGPSRFYDTSQGGSGGSDYSSSNPLGGSPAQGTYGDILNRLGQMGGNSWNNLADMNTWLNGGTRSAAEDYMNNFVVPYGNLMNNQQTQALNAWQAQNGLTEQQRVNTNAMNIANQQQALSQAGFNFATGPQFQQSINQFNRQQALAQQTQNQNFALGQGQNAYNAQNVANQFALGKQQNANQLTNYNQQFTLGNAANANTAQNNANNFALGQQANANTLTNYNQQYDLGKVANANNTQANSNQLYNYQQQALLGQGQLGFQNRQLDTQNTFNYKQLAQDAALAREKYANDVLNQRYSTFGRAQAPNARALLSWR